MNSLVKNHGLFQIESLDNRFRLYNVLYRGRMYVVDWSTELLDNERELTKNGEWQLASGPLYHASLAALHYNQDNDDKKQRNLVQQCREMHHEDFKKYWMITSTRIIYAPEGQDTIIHNYGSSAAQEKKKDFVGSNKYITKESKLEQEMKALFGTSDLEEIENVYNNLTGKKPYLWRVNIIPYKQLERPLVVGCSLNDFHVDADYSFYGMFPASMDKTKQARGVVVHQVNSFQKKAQMQGALSLINNDAGSISIVQESGNLSIMKSNEKNDFQKK